MRVWRERSCFGNRKLIAKSGPLADFFRHRFSTKYYDFENGLYYYGYRFYNPALMRWLNRDPIDVNGGVNLYEFCGNNAVARIDNLGLAHFEVRRLSILPAILKYSNIVWILGTVSPFLPLITQVPALILDLGLADKLNIEILHEHLFFDDGSDVGYANTGLLIGESKSEYVRYDKIEYDDCIMKEAVKRVERPPYSLIGLGAPKFNCQDYADSLRGMYEKIKDEKEVQCKCRRRNR